MESETMLQEPSLEVAEHDEPKEMRDVEVKKAPKVKRSNSSGFYWALTRGTSEQAIQGSMITNYIMHLR